MKCAWSNFSHRSQRTEIWKTWNLKITCSLPSLENFVFLIEWRWNKSSQFQKTNIYLSCTNQLYNTAAKANSVKERKRQRERRKNSPEKAAYTWVASFPGHLFLKCMLHTFTSFLDFKLSFCTMIMKMAGSRYFILTMKEREKYDSGCS